MPIGLRQNILLVRCKSSGKYIDENSYQFEYPLILVVEIEA